MVNTCPAHFSLTVTGNKNTRSIHYFSMAKRVPSFSIRKPIVETPLVTDAKPKKPSFTAARPLTEVELRSLTPFGWTPEMKEGLLVFVSGPNSKSPGRSYVGRLGDDRKPQFECWLDEPRVPFARKETAGKVSNDELTALKDRLALMERSYASLEASVIQICDHLNEKTPSDDCC